MLHNKIRNAAEFQGLEPDEILRRIHEETATKMANDLDKVKGGAPKGEVDPEEAFPSEIKLIARALAYRSGTLEDRQKLFDLLKRAYRVELEGEEAFRLGIDAVSEDNVEYYLSQEEYQWIVIEAPAGQTTEPEGTILGACCYSTDGQYRLKGEFHLAFSCYDIEREFMHELFVQGKQYAKWAPSATLRCYRDIMVFVLDNDCWLKSKIRCGNKVVS